MSNLNGLHLNKNNYLLVKESNMEYIIQIIENNNILVYRKDKPEVKVTFDEKYLYIPLEDLIRDFEETIKFGS